MFNRVVSSNVVGARKLSQRPKSSIYHQAGFRNNATNYTTSNLDSSALEKSRKTNKSALQTLFDGAATASNTTTNRALTGGGQTATINP